MDKSGSVFSQLSPTTASPYCSPSATYVEVLTSQTETKTTSKTTHCTMMASTDTSTTNCAACGKEGGNLNTCNKCHLVKYCNAACKKKHRSKHKKACEKRVAELHYEHELFKEHPPREECPICFLPLPRDIHQSSFKSCCGKVICNGCIYAMNEARGRGKKQPLCILQNSHGHFRRR